jgi:hypothetical protein
MRNLSIALMFACAASAHGQSPEMARLEKVLVGDWNTVEVMQFGKPVPDNRGRRGTVHVRLAGGGSVLVSEGHTNGAIGGDLQWLITIWWDPTIARYRFLTCFNDSGASGCELRGTAHWAGDTFVNEYNIKAAKCRDVWSDITPTSHTLTAECDSKPQVVSHDTRVP